MLKSSDPSEVAWSKGQKGRKGHDESNMFMKHKNHEGVSFLLTKGGSERAKRRGRD